MDKRLIQLFKKKIKNGIPVISDEKIDGILRESFEKPKRYGSIDLEPYNPESVVEYLIKEEGMKREEIETDVSSIFNYFSSALKEGKHMPVSKEEIAYLTMFVVKARRELDKE